MQQFRLTTSNLRLAKDFLPQRENPMPFLPLHPAISTEVFNTVHVVIGQISTKPHTTLVYRLDPRTVLGDSDSSDQTDRQSMQ